MHFYSCNSFKNVPLYLKKAKFLSYRSNSQSTSVASPQYFEKLKYYPRVEHVKPDHSFLWQKWVQQLVDQKSYYVQLQKGVKTLLREQQELTTGSVVNMPSKALALTNQKSLYYIDNANQQKSLVRRKKLNFYTYRKFRFNQLRLFYTTCNQHQFKSMYNNYNYIKKRVLDHFLLSLEGRLEFFLFRINFFPSKYFIKQFLHHHGVLVNGYLVHDKNYILKPWDVVSLPKKQHARVFSLLKDRTSVLRTTRMPLLQTIAQKKSLFKKFSSLNLSPLFSLNFLVNYPRYIEVDYTLLEAMFIRYPTVSEVTLPVNSEIENTNRSFYKW